MKGLQFDYKMPRYVYSKAAGKLMSSQYMNSKLSCLRFVDEPQPKLQNDEWVKVDVTFGGICGSDLNLIFLNDSPAVSTFASFPFTIGHEISGEISETGAEVSDLKAGDRVVVDPILSCAPRGYTSPCPACRNGHYSLCIHKAEGDLSPGLLIGSCRDTGGGWSSSVVAHKSQIFKLPDDVDDLNGAMIEPFSCALHSVLQNPPNEEDTVLVIGGGVIGISIIAAIRALDIHCKIVALVKHDQQADFASHYGADTIIPLRQSGYVPTLADTLSSTVLKPLFGPEVIQGGADIVYECVGRKQSINDGIRFLRSGGKVVLVGLAGILDGIDWTYVWLNELVIKGSFAYGTDHYKGKRVRTFEAAIDLMRLGKVDLSPLITHQFPLEDYKEALYIAANKSRHQAMKVVFKP